MVGLSAENSLYFLFSTMHSQPAVCLSTPQQHGCEEPVFFGIPLHILWTKRLERGLNWKYRFFLLPSTYSPRMSAASCLVFPNLNKASFMPTGWQVGWSAELLACINKLCMPLRQLSALAEAQQSGLAITTVNYTSRIHFWNGTGY